MKKTITQTATSGNTIDMIPLEFDINYHIFIIFVVLILSIITIGVKKE